MDNTWRGHVLIKGEETGSARLHKLPKITQLVSNSQWSTLCSSVLMPPFLYCRSLVPHQHRVPALCFGSVFYSVQSGHTGRQLCQWSTDQTHERLMGLTLACVADTKPSSAEYTNYRSPPLSPYSVLWTMLRDLRRLLQLILTARYTRSPSVMRGFRTCHIAMGF